MTPEGGPPTLQTSVPERKDLPQPREEEAIKGREALQFADMEREFLARKDFDPGEVWIVLSSELLFPSERADIPVSPYESGPLLKECLRRAGASSVVLALQERANELDGKIHALRGRRDAQETITDEGKEKAEEIDSQIAITARRLHGKFEQVEIKGEVKTIQTETGLSDRLNKRMEEEGLPEDRKEWTELYWKLRGSLTLLEIYNQRKRFLSSYDTYCEQLFLSGSYKIEMQMSEMLGILKDQEYGEEIDEAMKAYVDLHLGQGVKVKPGQFGPAFDGALNKYISSKNIRPDRDGAYLLPRPLQRDTSGDIAEREISSAYAVERAARAKDSGSPRYFVAERAELLAKRIMEFTLLTSWLCTPRRLDGTPEGTKLGMARLEGEGSSDMDKIVLATLKWQNERARNKPAGPGTWDWSKVPFEGFTQDFLHTAVNVEYLSDDGKRFDLRYRNEDGKELRGFSIKKNPTIFDLWYRGVEGRKYKLSEVFEGIKDSIDQCEIVREGIKEGEPERITVSRSAQTFSENAFDGWHFVMYKQSRCLGYALSDDRGGKEDPVAQIMTLEGLRRITKDAGTAFGWNPLVREWFKFNLVLSRLVAWYDKKGNPSAEFPVTAQELSNPRHATGLWTDERDSIKAAIEKSGYLDDKLTEVLFSKVEKFDGFVNFDDFCKEISKDHGLVKVFGGINTVYTLQRWAREAVAMFTKN